MSKIPTLTTLRVEDFPSEVRTWLPRLFTPLNQFLTVVTNTLQGRVNFGSNIASQDVNLSFTYGNSAQTFVWNLADAPKILWVGQALENGAFVTLYPSWSFNATAGTVSVDFYKVPGMTALTVGYSYKIFLRALP